MAEPQAEAQKTPDTPSTEADKVLERCIRIVAQCNKFKAKRLEQIAKYRDLYAGKVKKKYRQPFNVVLPVFSGMLDTLMAAFNDDLALEFREQEPADYLSVRKLNALWEMETNSVAPNAKFPLKTRQDRSNALFAGRGFMMNYAISDPSYHNVFETFELEDAIFDANGGGHWASHRYAGRENIIRSASDLRSGPYDQKQVEELIKNAGNADFDPSFEGGEDAKKLLSKFKAMGLAPEQATYFGESLFKLAEMRINIGSERYYIVFSPWYKVWVRFGKFSSVFSADIDPWVSWATHEDSKNFISKSYADDLYGVADAVHTLFNQELTNREKQNYNAQAYDMDMFPDVGKLDNAQTRPDALVPVDTKGGTRKIGEGLYSFKTPELQGTINLIQWIEEQSGKDVGITDMMMGVPSGVTKRATVILAEQQAISRRNLLRSSSYTEAMSEIGKLFIQGCKDHLPAKRAIRLLGSEGQGWEEITRADLDLYSDVDIRIISSSIEMKNSQNKKDARMKTLAAIGADPILAPQVNPRWRAEELLRSGGEYDDTEIKLALDVKNYGSKEEQAYAHQAIQAVLNNEKPDMFYGATTLFMQILVDFASNNRTSLGPQKYQALIQFALQHIAVVKTNMQRKARIDAAAVVNPPTPPAGDSPGGAPGQPPAPTPSLLPSGVNPQPTAALS